MNKNLIDELIDFFEEERLEAARAGSQFTEEEVETIISALDFYKNKEYI